MDEQAKKTALRMIPYGLYVLGVGRGERSTLSTVNWLTQASFQPPLVVVGVKQGTTTYDLLKDHGAFAVSVLGTGQKDVAFAFFRHVEPKEGKFGPYEYETATTGAPILTIAPAWFECRLTDVIERGDHAIVVGEVVEAGVRQETKALRRRSQGRMVGAFSGGRVARSSPLQHSPAPGVDEPKAEDHDEDDHLVEHEFRKAQEGYGPGKDKDGFDVEEEEEDSDEVVADVDLRPAATTGAPILTIAPAWFECRLTDVIERGDHAIVVGEVVEAGVRQETKALTMEECGVSYGG